ncbi:MAG TPA: hypothetical protein VN374_04300 [Desulfitobacteriaceae bacterium]|nr:hypothetical protein [Desulfitobacteriaceae bacterium]
MAREFFKSKYWLGNGHLSHKRHVDMTEEEIALIAQCTGEILGKPCRNHVYRCSVCGNYGCMQELIELCTEQGFNKDECLNCGATGSQIPVTE